MMLVWCERGGDDAGTADRLVVVPTCGLMPAV